MKALSVEAKTQYLTRRTHVLLAELEETCQQALKLFARLETPGLSEKQVDELLGELSALVVHIHEHTRGLDKIIDRDARASRTSGR